MVEVHRYWRLARSVRVGRRVIQQTVAQIGELDEHGRLEARALARHLIGTPEHARLFHDGSADLTVPVRLKGIRVERSRQFGAVYLALALWKTLELWQQRAGLGNSSRTVLEELLRIQSHDVVLPTASHGDIRLRCVTQPDAAQAVLLERLGIVLPKRMRLGELELPALDLSA